MFNDCGEHPSGGVRRSLGWRRKVDLNNLMQDDNRSLALVGGTDGVPFFDDKRLGCWPFVLRVANLVSGMSVLVRNCHIVGLQGSYYMEPDSNSVASVRVAIISNVREVTCCVHGRGLS